MSNKKRATATTAPEQPLPFPMEKKEVIAQLRAIADSLEGTDFPPSVTWRLSMSLDLTVALRSLKEDS